MPAQKIVATAENFMTDVVEASTQAPVLVDFWAPWCGPCQSLMPLLDRLAEDYDGRFVLAKVNTDEQPQLASHFQIRSIPTVLLVHQGEVVDQFVGAQPESAIRAMLDRHVAPVAGAAEPAPAAMPAPAAEAAPTAESALRVAEPAQAVEAPTRPVPPDVQAERSLEQRDADGAAAAIAALAAADAAHPALKSLRARLAFVQLANANPDVMALREALQANPGDSAARHALAAHHAVFGDYGTALAEWVELLRRDRAFGDEAARRSLLQAFDVLGDGDPLVTQYRRRMASLLH
ncbi:MAG TPA: thioredoxin [Steroidobacteraceae bacterium]|nr:thioredoxin [Steroidobacteraceae bacterium]